MYIDAEAPNKILFATHNVIGYICPMIQSIKHKGLRLFFEKDDASKLPPQCVEKIRRILYRLDEAESIEDMNQVGWGLHSLSGNLKDFHSVKVDRNYRIIFRFEQGQCFDVDYVDYH